MTGRHPHRVHLLGPLVAGLSLVLVGCTAAPGSSPSGSPQPTAAATSSVAQPPTPTPALTEAEPTTTNTLPPPPLATRPAPSTAGDLDAGSLPVPAGWRSVALKGDDEQGQGPGNGTWVHARDPRYAAQDVITIGCADVTRDDYTDPTAALEGNYRSRSGEPGVGLVLEFADEPTATHFFDLYTAQVQACTHRGDPVRIRPVPGVTGLADRRSYPDGQWTEVGRQVGRRITLIVLSDPGFAISATQAQRLLDRISG